MKKTVCLLALAVLLSKSVYAGECKEFIELLSAKKVAKELGKTEAWVVSNHKVNLWEKTSFEMKGNRVGELLPGSRALLLEEAKNDYKVKSPLDKSTGWVSKIQVKKTLYQDTETFEKCKPKKEVKKGSDASVVEQDDVVSIVTPGIVARLCPHPNCGDNQHITRIPKGTTLEVEGIMDVKNGMFTATWYEVTFKGKRGWVSEFDTDKAQLND